MVKINRTPSIEKSLLVLSSAALLLFLALGGALLFVQSRLDSDQRYQISTIGPLRQSMYTLQTGVAGIFQRENDVRGTHSTVEFNKVPSRQPLESQINDSYANLQKILRNESGGADQEVLLTGVREKIDTFLKKDSELLESVAHHHRLQEQFVDALKEIEAGFRGFVESAQSISGNVRLGFIVKLRKVAAHLNDASGRADMREIIYGDSRPQLEVVIELVAETLNLGMLNGKLGLARSEDELNTILANEITQNGATIAKAIDTLVALTAKQKGLVAKTEGLKNRFQVLLNKVADQKNPQSLAALRRESLQEEGRARDFSFEIEHQSKQLSDSLVEMNQHIDTLVNGMMLKSHQAAQMAKLLSTFLSLAGIVLCAFAAIRIRGSVSSLRATNSELSLLRDSLTEANAALDEKVQQRTAAIRAILDNVNFGLFMCERNLKVLEGSSRSCPALVGRSHDSTLEGESLLDLLRLEHRAADSFRTLHDQLFEDIMPEEMSIEQLPSKFQLEGKILSLRASVIRDQQAAIKSILFCVSDITKLEKAEKEVEEIKGLLQMLKSKANLQSFLMEFNEALPGARQKCRFPGEQAALRTILHTWKGNFGVLGMPEASKLIHALEDEPEIKVEKIDELEKLVEASLQQNYSILRLDLKANPNTFEIFEEDLLRLGNKVKVAEDVTAAAQLVKEFVSSTRRKPAQEYFGMLSETVERLAFRFAKDIQFEFLGEKVRIPLEHLGFVHSLPHLLRNAVDHGIEGRNGRGAKPAQARIRFTVKETDQHIHYVLEDDGCGIDLQALTDKALAKGILTPAEVALMSPQGKLELIYHPGLSTSESVSEISGRGVGMLAVKESVVRQGGKINVQSQPGMGTRFDILLPIAFDKGELRTDMKLAS